MGSSTLACKCRGARDFEKYDSVMTMMMIVPTKKYGVP